MPYINIAIAGEPSSELSQRIATRISAETQKHLKKDPAVTSVSVRFQPAQDWFIGGEAQSDMPERSFWLDIKVTAGTNTKGEIAAYLGAVHSAMGALLGGVHPISYALVDEVPAANWGFGGKSQEYRYIQARVLNPPE